MRNEWLNKFKTTYYIKVKGRNIERFIKRLISVDIELLEIKYLKYDEIVVKIYKNNLEKIEEIKTVYDVEVVEYTGFYKYKELLKKNKLIVISIVLAFTFVLYLSNTIFYIDVIHNDKNIRELIKEELSENGIRIYSLKKDYKYINKVKNKIMEKHKDKIEWLEIESSGTRYIVKVEERKINDINGNNEPRNLVAKKDAVILSIEASDGIIVKNKNDYVKKGDIIVSGNIDLNGEIKKIVPATGKVYGEVWYKLTIEYPLNYTERKVTGETKKVYTFKFMSLNISLYNNYLVTKEKILYKNKTIPFSIVKQTKNKILNINQTLTKEEATSKAIEVGLDKIKSKLNDNEYIIDTKKLKVETNNSKIILELFVSVCEDITDYSLVEGELNV